MRATSCHDKPRCALPEESLLISRPVGPFRLEPIRARTDQGPSPELGRSGPFSRLPYRRRRDRRRPSRSTLVQSSLWTDWEFSISFVNFRGAGYEEDFGFASCHSRRGGDLQLARRPQERPRGLPAVTTDPGQPDP